MRVASAFTSGCLGQKSVRRDALSATAGSGTKRNQVKDTPPPDFETWGAFWEAEKKLVSERGPAPYGNGCGRWWCCGTWWAADYWKKHTARMAKGSDTVTVDFETFLAGFKARHADAYKSGERSTAGNVERQAVVVTAPADFKSAAAGEDAEVVEDGYHGIE